MATRSPFRSAALVLVLATLPVCDGADRPADPPPLPTADPYARGYTDADFPRVQEVAPGVYTYEQLRSAGEERFTTVSLFVVTDEGVLVADGQGNEAETRRLVETIAGITPHPITHVVIASDHGDHTGGNAAFPATATFVAHPTSAAVLRGAAEAGASAVREGGPDGAAGSTLDDTAARQARLPTVEVPERLELELGGRRIQVLHLGRAHTGGDLVVHLPEEGVAFLSEAFLHRVFPAMRSAFPSEWVAMLDAALALDARMYVPGHGFVDAPEVLRRELEVYRDAVQAVVDEGRRLHAAGLSLEEAQAAADFGELESWSLRESQGDRALQQVYAELNGELPPAGG